MSLSAQPPQSRRLLCLIAGLSTAHNVAADLPTLAARTAMEPGVLRAVLGELATQGLVSAGGGEYQLTMTGWDVADDTAAVNPRSDLDEKQREYSRAAAAVARFTEFSSPEGEFAAAVRAEEIAKHRYNRAVARYLNQPRNADRGRLTAAG